MKLKNHSRFKDIYGLKINFLIQLGLMAFKEQDSCGMDISYKVNDIKFRTNLIFINYLFEFPVSYKILYAI